MFSRDPRHNRPTPRTVQQAFGPYHKFTPIGRRRHDGLWAIVSVLVVGAVFGAMFFFGWSR